MAVAHAGRPCLLMMGTVSASPAWTPPRRGGAYWDELLLLRELESYLSALTDRFLFRERLRPPPPGACEEEKVG